MYDITRFEPFSGLARLDPFMDAGDLLNKFATRQFFRTGMEIEPQMKMDVMEADGKYLVKAEIPGVNKDDIRINIDRNRVSISAELKQEKGTGKRVIRSERSYGMASRSFSLADEVDQSGVEAKYNNGVLELTLPKKPGGATRREIPIS